MRGMWFSFIGCIMMVGCGKSPSEPAANSQAATPISRADAEVSIKTHMNQCGLNQVALHDIQESAVPAAAVTATRSWAYTFVADYTTITNDTQRGQAWLAILAMENGTLTVRSCQPAERTETTKKSEAARLDVEIVPVSATGSNSANQIIPAVLPVDVQK